MTISGRDASIIGSGRATLVLPMGTTIVIEDALLYPESTRTLLSFKDIRSNNFHVETISENNTEYLLLKRAMGLRNKLLRNSPHFHLDYITVI